MCAVSLLRQRHDVLDFLLSLATGFACDIGQSAKIFISVCSYRHLYLVDMDGQLITSLLATPC